MEFFLVDAFTDTAFAGNTAAVVLLDEQADDTWMQSVAAEFKHSETAFVQASGTAQKQLRWFTPTTEVDLCGHATLATAHVLGGDHTFRTRSGDLHCTDTGGGWIQMDFPADHAQPLTPDAQVAAALQGVTIDHYAQGVADLLVVAAKPDQVRALEPDLTAIAALPVRGVIVTAPSDRDDIDFISRCFYPGSGVGEDPVTGSAHCTLAPYWSQRIGADELVGAQVSARGGVVRTTLRGDRVGLSGRAVTVARGDLLV
ncbi:MAG: PhzF family phenazine biosynthesis protein [Pseudonocardiaceae bacterium]